jgi:acyl-CoA synthetase (AMP-forming)/AMP-acid ligase II
LCHSLQRLGVARGDRILVLGTSSAPALEIILAAFRLGAVAMPLNPLLGHAAIATIVERVRPVACFQEEPLPSETDAVLQKLCRVVVSMRAASGSQHARTFATLLEGPEAVFEPVQVGPEEPALVIHTSGSQGTPRAIVMTHERLKAYLDHNTFLFSQFFDPDPTVAPAMVSVLPFSHLGGLGTCLVMLSQSGTLHLPGTFVPRTYLAALEASKCRFISLVPSMYRSLMKDPGLTRTDLSHLKFCITLGEPCSEELARRISDAFGAIVASAYGLTECLTGIGHMRSDLLSGAVKPGSCGTLCFGEIRLVADSGAISENCGELWVRNSTVSRCYREDSLNDARLEDGWFKTRDLFFRDADGHFFHRGRCDEMFISNGKNIYPAEIESLLAKHPQIDTVCAAPVQSTRKGTIPAVLVVAKPDTSAQSIIDFAARHGAAHAIPQFVQFTASLPRVGPGKIDRVAAGRMLQQSFDTHSTGAQAVA